jgi:hypothetical protein
MALNDIERKRVEKAVGAFMQKRRPTAHIRPKLDFGFRISGQSVELFAIRPQWDRAEVKRESPFAKATFVRTKGVWRVFWMRSDLKWHGYGPAPDDHVSCRISRDGQHRGLGSGTRENVYVAYRDCDSQAIAARAARGGVARYTELDMKAALLALALNLAAPHAGAEEFVFAVTAPGFKVTIPNLPRLRMEPHPMQATHPHLRYLGAQRAYTISVITARAAAGMGALECASAILRTLDERPNVPPAAELYRTRLDEHTYAVLYAAHLPGFLQLNAHFLSAAGGTHCIEVHVSKIAASPEDLGPWFESFGKAKIEPD